MPLEIAPPADDIQRVRREMAAEAPLAFDQLVAQITWTCTAACAMCYQSAGPKGSDDFGRADLTVDDLKAVLASAIALPNVEPHFHLVGGEALMRLDDSLRIVRMARDVGFREITLTTNAFWAARPERAESVAGALADAGLTRMDVSWDRWRRPLIPPAAIDRALSAAAAHGVGARLRLLVEKGETPEDLLNDLDAADLARADEIFTDAVAATGRARRKIDADRFHAHGDLAANCHRALSLTINPAGDVYPCCSGLDQTRSLGFGNIRETPLGEIVAAMDASLLLRQIVFEGVGSLVPILQAADALPAGRPSSICSLCWSIFSDAKSVAALKAAFPEERWAA